MENMNGSRVPVVAGEAIGDRCLVEGGLSSRSLNRCVNLGRLSARLSEADYNQEIDTIGKVL